MPQDSSDLKSYLEGLAKRVASLEVKAEEAEMHIQDQQEKITKKTFEFKEDIRDLKDEMDEVRGEIDQVSQDIRHLIQNFKRVTRENSLERLKRKVDEWEPENLATHRQLHRQLKKLKK